MVFLGSLVLLRMWIIRMWLIDMWLSHRGLSRRWLGHMWPCTMWVAGQVRCEGREAVGSEAGGQVVEGVGPGVGEDAVEVAAEGAVRPALAVDGQDAVAIDADVEEMGPGGGERVRRGDVGAGADGGAGGEGPAVLVGVEGDLYKDGKGVAAAAGVEVVDLVAEGDGDLGIDEVLSAVQRELAPVKDGDHAYPPLVGSRSIIARMFGFLYRFFGGKGILGIGD
ncbi:MAG: hypothetical protein ACK2UC_01575 [Anaerolineae bacterium]